MNLLTSALRVRRLSHRHEYGGIQILLREWRLLGVRVWSAEIDRENVPAWAEIQIGALGSTEWRSKFAAHI